MFLTVVLGLVASLLFVPFGKFLKSKWSVLIPLVPAFIFAYYVLLVPGIVAGEKLQQQIPWVPSVGVNLDFRLDGLSMLFALIISGIGTAIFVYGRSYMKGYRYFDRFFAFLLVFMSAMLGVVLADNVLLLFIFWELTSISSFFLIGFNADSGASRRSALQALAVTGLGGLFLLVGMILLGDITGTFVISEMVQHKEMIVQHERYPLLVLFVLLGAFTKSAHFPFHFWLPGAMKAPTPVSAYLHSATMVKAGIYLMARFTPVMGGTDIWNYSLMIIGGITMLYAAVHSLFRTDMKGILAYSTISGLGILTFLLGLGTREAIIPVSVFILVHALYKATLFMITGIVDHETKTRDIIRLAGLRKVMMPVFVAALLAALSSAGLPLTYGFIGKDLIYEATLALDNNLAPWLTALAVATNIALVAAGFMVGVKPFTGALPAELSKVHLPSPGMWLPPLMLGVLGLIFGMMPGVVGELFNLQSANSIFGDDTELKLKIWHGFNLVLYLSIATLVAGTGVYLLNKPGERTLAFTNRFESVSPGFIITRMADSLLEFARWTTNRLHDGYLRNYILKIVMFAIVLLAMKVWMSGPVYVDYLSLQTLTIYEIAIIVILLGAVYLVVTTSSRLTAVVSTSVIGYAICLLFVIYSAPDLAMTQFSIDTLTTILFVLVLYRLPGFMKSARNIIVLRDVVVSLCFGALLSIISLKVLVEDYVKDISAFYGENAYVLAKGKNVVNVILVDFRGMDTMFETVVLGVAALGVYSLLKLRLKSSEKE
ncbi:MAG: proton-conducting transporter membrane subunit [Weeksellaceae bacterium]|nr:proton-conducting transporter membrane subunit [Weeksellaceae bacterium]